MTTNPNGLLFNSDDIRNIVIRARMLGLRRERVLAALTGRPNNDRQTARAVRASSTRSGPPKKPN
jgi:hypothetical protein